MRKLRLIVVPLRAALWVVILLAAAAAAGLWMLHRRPPKEPVRAALESALSRFLERRVTIASVDWGYAPPGVVGRDVRVQQYDGREMAFCGKVRMGLAWRSLARGRLDVERVTFLSPRIHLRRTLDGDTDLSRMIRQIHGRMREGRALGSDAAPVDFHRFEIRSGRLLLAEDARGDAPLATSLLMDADGTLEGEPGARSFPFTLKARVESGPAAGPLSLQGRLGTGEEVRVESPGLPLSLFAERAPWLAPWEGLVVFAGRWDVQERRGRVGGRVRARPAEGPQDLWLAGDFALDNGSTSTASLVLTDAGTEARLDVSLSPPPERTAWVAFVSTGSDLNRLSAQWARVRPPKPSTATAVAPAPFAPPPWRVEATAEVRNALLGGETLEDLSFSAARERDGTVLVRRLDARAFGGALTAGATYYAGPDGSPRFGVSWRLGGLDAARLLGAVGAKPVFSGVGASTGALDGAWPVGDWSRMDGEVSFSVRDGVARGLPGLVTSFSHLNLTSLFSRKDADGGLLFDRAAGRFTMAGGVVTFREPALFENRTLQVAFSGDVDVARRAVDAAMVLHFLTFVGEVVRAVPGLGSVLMGGKKSLFPVVVRLKGPLSNPDIDYQAARSLLAPFWSPFRRPPSNKGGPRPAEIRPAP